jgi:hypothetical protein
MVTDNIIYGGNVVTFGRDARMTEVEYDAELAPILVLTFDWDSKLINFAAEARRF